MTIKPGYIRVSEILAQWDRFGHIQKETLANKAALGTQVHEAINAYANNYHLPLTLGEGYFQSFAQWIETSQASIVHHSKRLYCDKLKITGEIDALIQFPGCDELILVDWKTAHSSDDLFWQLQGQFYAYLCKFNGIDLGSRFLFIQLDREGNLPKVREYKSSSSLMNVCMSAFICYKYINRLD